MWCKKCNIETNEEYCPICGSKTVEDIPTEIYWCDHCKTPIINLENQADKGVCPICGNPTRYIAKDLRPVFPEERLLVEGILHKRPNEYVKASVWAEKNRYFFDGRVEKIPAKTYLRQDVEDLKTFIKENSKKNTYEFFNEHIETFIEANEDRLNYLIDEASEFVKDASKDYPEENLVISFSGGKDSTVTADVVTKALSNPSLVHIFGDTTLEFPSTKIYAERFRENHPFAIFQVARNDDQVFLDVAEDIGPPARLMRWCCSMFKTGPITRVLNNFYGNQHILTFYGIRKAESVSRSKYDRISGDNESVKIQKQTVASPIFFWHDIDIWLYILEEDIDFNDAYRLGYDRVGCWLCPNNNLRAQFLSRIYMPERSKEWRDFLIRFAKKVGKPDPEVYVDEGWWKARQGGQGLKAANDVKIKYTNCTTEDHAKIYQLYRPFDDELLNMFTSFGRVAPELGNKLLNETIVLDVKTNVPILSIQPFSQDGFEYAVKIRTMNVADHDDLQRKAAYQVRKFNACRKCLKCESVCSQGAIQINADSYYIDPKKCVHCMKCVNQKYLQGGCMMDKYLRTKSIAESIREDYYSNEV